MSAPPCIDLAERFGRHYRIRYEAQAATWPMDERRWLARIACTYGHVGVPGGERLHAFTDHPRIGAQLRALPYVERAEGDAEVRVVFHVDHLPEVLAILKPYRRRQVSEAERGRLRTMGSAALAQHRANGNVESDDTAPESPQSDGNGETDVPGKGAA